MQPYQAVKLFGWKSKGRGRKRITRETKKEGERRGRGHVSARWKI